MSEVFAMSQGDFEKKVRPYGIVGEELLNDEGYRKKVRVWVLGTVTWLGGFDCQVRFLDREETKSHKNETELTVWVYN